MTDPVPQFLSNMDVTIEFFQKLALATLIGILIGIEREHRRPEGIELIAGVRTFTMASIAGMISSYLAQTVHTGIILITLVFFAIISAIYAYVKNAILKQPGITGPIALFCTYLLGIFIAYEFYLIAIAIAVIMTLLLAEKRPLHSFATNLADDEIQSAVRFLAVVFILYPITPDELFMGVINPRWILRVVIIVATISFISFIIMKQMGASYGLPLSGMLGGLVNSEATTGAVAGMVKKRNELVTSGYIGIILSNAAMLIRNLLIAFIVDPSGRVLLLMAPPQLIITSFAIAAVIRSENNTPVSETIKLESPFALSSAIKFAFGFAALSIISTFANMWAGAAGVYATALGGLISSAVVTASATTLAVSDLVPHSTAALTAVMASIVSTGSKILLVKWAGPSELSGLIKRTFTYFIILGTAILIIWGIYISYTY
ncbi:putative membrane protein [Candidatus Methanoperedens nitroreducens]|uniref:Putative membrane protein n=1 Tax=Candidatus Methanoperedens nitratireducens TaxID=1392998 RepID=A0A062V9G8_9EURY|nr:MgtC/SapB family protein [Candidatus Methanoperedens nitroreducens]KCZ73203.1 putative membrane protein [Candidatus Methanoperedens nitroreducens]MDJ1422848.1 MgtC/SapB family protein [Candidatus Methanoperedens sp.]